MQILWESIVSKLFQSRRVKSDIVDVEHISHPHIVFKQALCMGSGVTQSCLVLQQSATCDKLQTFQSS